jgi:nucleoside 2-deoxyribosyltransferase
MADQSVLATHTTDPATTSEPLSHPPQTYTYYHAGPLFTLAELHTNVLLSSAIKRASSSKFNAVLPQDLEQRDLSPHSIRDEDLRALLSCDLALFTYDGAELDAGTVVEFMTAKMADIPCVILRTDFRGAGDQGSQHGGDSWNLMSSNWPRAVSVSIDAMVAYKSCLARTLEAGAGEGTLGESLVEEVARKVVDGFERVLSEKPRLSKELREGVFQWLAVMPGFKNALSANEGEEGEKTNQAFMKRLCEEKVAKGLL